MKNDTVAIKVLLCITILPNLLSVILALVGIKSLISLIAYSIGFLFLPMLKCKTQKLGTAILPIMLFMGFFLFSYSYSVAKITSWDKFVSVIYNIILPLLLIIFLFRKKIDAFIIENNFFYSLKKYSTFILVMLAGLLLAGFTETGDDAEGRLTVIGMRNAIWCSRFVGFLILPSVVCFLSERKLTFMDVIGFLCALYIMISSGSRGPILSILVVILVSLFPKMKIRYRVITLMSVFIVYEAFMMFSERFTSGSAEYSNLARIEFINNILDSKFNIWRGVGIGSFGLFMYGEDSFSYPHNLFFETYVETGVAGLLLLTLALVATIRKCKLTSYYFMFTVYFFANAMVSGDITGNNYLFVFAALILLTYTKSRLLGNYITNQQSV